MASNFVAMCYAVAKKSGVDTSKMTPEQVVEWYNKQQGKKEAKGKATELIKEFVAGDNATNVHANSMNIKQTTETDDSSTKKYFVEKVDRTNEKVLQSKITEYSNRIVKSDIEHSIVIDKDGNVYETTGDAESVAVIGVDLDGGISIHNHLEDGSFEQDDFNFYRDKIETKFICVTPKFMYKLKVLKEIDKPYNYFYRNGMIMYDESINQAHNVMEFIKKEGYVEYEKSVRNS